MIRKKFAFIILILIGNILHARQHDNSHLDTLSGKSFDYLRSSFESSMYDRTKSKIYLSAWLQKAKSDHNNYYQLASAYRATALITERPLRLFYADSMILNAVLSKNEELIGTSYMSKGAIHYDRMEHLKALDNYLLADRYISKVGNPVLTHKIKYCISQIKYYLGFYHEAIALLRECVDYYEEENDHAYLSSLHTLGLCYARIGEHQSASKMNELGIEQIHLFDENRMQYYFEHSEGINQYYLGSFNEAIKRLKEAVNGIKQSKDYANEAVAYFYIGQSYWSLKQFDNALSYFKKVDEIFQRENYMLPDLRKGYENLIEYYTRKKDTPNQLFYINQLLKVDRLLAEDYKHLLIKVVKEYDTKELLKAKETIENSMQFTRVTACIVVSLMSVTIGYLIYRNRRNKKLFEELMSRDTSNSNVIIDFEEYEADNSDIVDSDVNQKSGPEISPDIEIGILKKLEKFEATKKYLETDLNLAKMATILHTNSKYVTKVVAKHRGKGTIEYITELKLDYIIEMLKTNSKYRNYTNKALGEDAGFKTTQNFTRAFKSYTGISPTYFIYKLKKSITADNSE
ncbi:tetratricopeptide repeat protein [Flavobacterium sp.]